MPFSRILSFWLCAQIISICCVMSLVSAAEVSRWTFNGDAIDTIGGRNGTLLGDAAYSGDVPPDHSGSSLQLDGTLDKMIFDVQGTDALNKSFTVSAWIKPTTSRSNGWLSWFGTRAPNDAGFDFKAGLANNATIRVDLGNGSSFPVISDTAADLGAGAWHHVALAVQPNQYDLFLDAVKIRHADFTAFTPILWDANHDIAVGAISASLVPNGPPTGEDFAGLIKNVRVFNTALTSEADIRPLLGDVPEPSSLMLLFGALAFSLNGRVIRGRG